MQLLSVTISGFKSFAGSFSLSIGPGMTAVIGPNGSGKSNLAEAIRWVLGEQSAKSLRSTSAADVIFAGSPKRKAASKASVTLVFDNSDGRFPYEAAEISLSRTIWRSGESEYAINSDPVRLLDIQHMLAQAGIGTKTYSVISQGTIDHYLNTTPAGRRALFDEATGVKSLQLKLNEAQHKLDKAVQLDRELSLVQQELLPRLQVLQREVKRYAEGEKLAVDLADKQTIFFHAGYQQGNCRVERLTAIVEAGEQALAQAQQRREAAEGMLFSAAQTPADSGASAMEIELAVAEKEYVQARHTWEATEAERKRLQALRSTTKAETDQAMQLLEQKRSELVAFDWLKNMRAVLRTAKDFLAAVRTGQPLEGLEALETAIVHMLETSDDTLPVEAARALLQHIEEPVRNVSRLQTLEKEYADRLRSLPDVSQPSDKKVLTLRQQLEDVPHGQASVDLVAVEGELASARAMEMTAMQELQTARLDFAQAKESLRVLEGEVLRERGTAFLQMIQTTPAPTENIVTLETLRRLEAKVEALGAADPLVQKECAEVETRYAHVSEQLADTQAAQLNIRQLQEDLQRRIEEQFSVQFAVIAHAFSDYFAQLFGGGQASLISTAEGIEMAVQLPGKKARQLQGLSGGEKALTALALLFAILRVQEPPFLVLDEVDAALDEANADRFAILLQLKSAKTQCIVITHNRATMGYAHVLYGVTMAEPGVSSVYSVKLQDVQVGTAQEVPEMQV